MIRGVPDVGGIVAGAAGCCAHDTGPGTKAGGTGCTRTVSWAGTVYFPHPKPDGQTCRTFTCQLHKALLDNLQPYGSNPRTPHRNATPRRSQPPRHARRTMEPTQLQSTRPITRAGCAVPYCDYCRHCACPSGPRNRVASVPHRKDRNSALA